MKHSTYRLVTTLFLITALILPCLVSADGGYEKEMLTTDFDATGRAFYALARVNAEGATGTYLRELQSDDSRTKAFLNYGCLVKCLYPPEDGWVVVELFNAAGVVHEKDLTFHLEVTKPVQNNAHPVRHVVLSLDSKEANPNWHEVLQAGQPCTVLYLSWPSPEAYHHYYFIQTDEIFGYVPMDAIALMAN